MIHSTFHNLIAFAAAFVIPYSGLCEGRATANIQEEYDRFFEQGFYSPIVSQEDVRHFSTYALLRSRGAEALPLLEARLAAWGSNSGIALLINDIKTNFRFKSQMRPFVRPVNLLGDNSFELFSQKVFLQGQVEARNWGAEKGVNISCSSDSKHAIHGKYAVQLEALDSSKDCGATFYQEFEPTPEKSYSFMVWSRFRGEPSEKNILRVAIEWNVDGKWQTSSDDPGTELVHTLKVADQWVGSVAGAEAKKGSAARVVISYRGTEDTSTKSRVIFDYAELSSP